MRESRNWLNSAEWWFTATRNRTVVVFAAIAALSISASYACASQFVIADNVELVVLDVSVLDSHGRLVTDLEKSNFKVFEDGHPRVITQFDKVNVPVTLGLVVDNSGSMASKRPEVITAGLAFAKESNVRDQFFVVNFNDSVTRGLPPDLPFTDDLRLLRKALYFGQTRGQTALYDALAYALKHLELSHDEKRTLIVVSDGGDNVSSTSFAGLMREIEASRATIYTVGLYDPAARDLNPGVLHKIANVSGGEYFEPKGLSDVIPTFDKISRDIRHRYTIGYTPDLINDKCVLRKVKVIAQQGEHKLNVRTRSTYSTAPASKLIADLACSGKKRP